MFYLLYGVGVTVFVTSGATTPLQALAYGALFGLVAYATFDLTVLATFKHWTWNVAALDVAWGAAVTGAVSALAVWVADRFAS